MRTVNIAELKNKLSTYITYAKAGETVVIRDRNTPVAQLTPFPNEGWRRRTLAGGRRDSSFGQKAAQLCGSGQTADAEGPRQCRYPGAAGRSKRVVVTERFAFWDSSAMVPLCFQERTSVRARALLRQFAPVVWWTSGGQRFAVRESARQRLSNCPIRCGR